jgi:hypothetical protein
MLEAELKVGLGIAAACPFLVPVEEFFDETLLKKLNIIGE